jgi:hypothetical protein
MTQKILNFKEKYDTIYINGSSHAAGGGFEISTIEEKQKQIKGYKEILDIEYSNPKEVSYANRLSELLNIKVVNEAKSGGGPERIIRKIHQYIKDNSIDKLKKTLFILEIPSTNRLDLWSNEFMEHLVCNIDFKKGWDGRLQTFDLDYIHLVREHWQKDDILEMKYTKYFEAIQNFIKYFHNPVVYERKIENELIGLFSILKHMGIDFYIMQSGMGLDFHNKYNLELEDKHFIKIFDDIRPNIIPPKDKYFTCISIWSGTKGLRILDEIGREYSNDYHAGYEANKIWAELLADFILKNY